MRRALLVALALSLLGGALFAPAQAKKKKRPKPPPRVERTAEGNYDSPAIGSRDATGTCSGSNGCVMFGVGAEELYLALEITDGLGMPVAATIGQDTDPSTPTVEVVGRICGSTEEPLAITPGIEVTIWLWVAPAVTAPTCPGMASSGTVKGTFSNYP